VVIAMNNEKNYYIGTLIGVEMDYSPFLGMIASSTTPDIAMLIWIAFIEYLNPKFKHILGKDNLVAVMLLRA
jgi:nicotinamide mononucleotide adenylyltransferase